MKGSRKQVLGADLAEHFGFRDQAASVVGTAGCKKRLSIVETFAVEQQPASRHTAARGPVHNLPAFHAFSGNLKTNRQDTSVGINAALVLENEASSPRPERMRREKFPARHLGFKSRSVFSQSVRITQEGEHFLQPFGGDRCEPGGHDQRPCATGALTRSSTGRPLCINFFITS